MRLTIGQMAKRMAIIATHGTLDAGYPPLILATAAVAMDMEVAIFFTFYGLEIIFLHFAGLGSKKHLPLSPKNFKYCRKRKLLAKKVTFGFTAAKKIISDFTFAIFCFCRQLLLK